MRLTEKYRNEPHSAYECSTEEWQKHNAYFRPFTIGYNVSKHTIDFFEYFGRHGVTISFDSSTYEFKGITTTSAKTCSVEKECIALNEVALFISRLTKDGYIE